MKKKLIASILATIVLLSAAGCGSSAVSDAYNEALSEVQQEIDEQAAALEEELYPEETELSASASEADPDETEPQQAVEETDETADEETDEDTDEIGTGVYEVDGISVNYYASVRNDTTGNWRLGVIYDGSDLNTYVVDYYNYFCKDDSEIHGIVNLGTETTVLISKVMSDTLEISVMEYVDGEEHDANLLYSGSEIERYWINMDTLEVDPIDDDE
ncbi:MAG: hypothetical protein LUC83_03090 [Clostridiales bacterium]|nr:hypothetical protein [Clostridiales bacterium]